MASKVEGVGAGRKSAKLINECAVKIASECILRFNMDLPTDVSLQTDRWERTCTVEETACSLVWLGNPEVPDLWQPWKPPGLVTLLSFLIPRRKNPKS